MRAACTAVTAAHRTAHMRSGTKAGPGRARATVPDVFDAAAQPLSELEKRTRSTVTFFTIPSRTDPIETPEASIWTQHQSENKPQSASDDHGRQEDHTTRGVQGGKAGHPKKGADAQVGKAGRDAMTAGGDGEASGHRAPKRITQPGRLERGMRAGTQGAPKPARPT